ncbi:MAG TPA: bifunctional adenosylcobinamide kinase/adenosylcobinamide-phosphate guanylyltransferase [Candidatus Limnocylindrales bacterium]|nr:bifunctional adenosylcobinamide kinase/adenosylcobinamide-phosphate guanylyltransferase [Candidatus Limnocylindrales bacterium]
MPHILLLGGARSGKSTLALEIAARSGAPVTMIATAEPLDPEMAERIAHHRAQRPSGWTTIEEPVALLEAVQAAPARSLLIIDCLTLWVSNLVGQGQHDPAIVAAAGRAATTLAARPGGAIVVSNEVGLGIIPVNPVARGYRDTLGRVNAAFAALADRTALVVAGRLHELTSATEFMEGITWHAR